MMIAPISRQTKISSTNGIFTCAPKRLTTTVAVFSRAKTAIMIKIMIEAMVVDCFFMENSPLCSFCNILYYINLRNIGKGEEKVNVNAYIIKASQ